MARIAVVDDEKNIRSTIKDILEDLEHRVDVYVSGEEFLSALEEEAFDLALMDIRMPGKSGLEVLEIMKGKKLSAEVIIISGHGNIDLAVEAVKKGAYNFLQKPLSLEKVEIAVQRALEFKNQKEELRQWHESREKKYQMVGDSTAMTDLKGQILKAAPTQSRVLILGESGTGKELVAHGIHNNSTQKGGPFIKINCAAIPETLIESELFGHEKGSFTGALSRKIGRFEQAHNGTMFLDEIGDMSPVIQGKVLRLLEESEFERVGGTETIRVKVRVIAATHKDLEKMVEQGTFRQDLYFRLNVFQIKVPALEQHLEDIPELSQVFLEAFCQENSMPPKSLSPQTLDTLQQRPYPGNIRELKNIIERLAILADSTEIGLEQVEALNDGSKKTSMGIFTRTLPLAEAKHGLEKLYVETQIKKFKWDIQQTADKLGLERTNLYRKLKQLGIEIKGEKVDNGFKN